MAQVTAEAHLHDPARADVGGLAHDPSPSLDRDEALMADRLGMPAPRDPYHVEQGAGGEALGVADRRVQRQHGEVEAPPGGCVAEASPLAVGAAPALRPHADLQHPQLDARRYGRGDVAQRAELLVLGDPLAGGEVVAVAVVDLAAGVAQPREHGAGGVEVAGVA